MQLDNPLQKITRVVLKDTFVLDSIRKNGGLISRELLCVYVWACVHTGAHYVPSNPASVPKSCLCAQIHSFKNEFEEFSLTYVLGKQMKWLNPVNPCPWSGKRLMEFCIIYD